MTSVEKNKYKLQLINKLTAPNNFLRNKQQLSGWSPPEVITNHHFNPILNAPIWNELNQNSRLTLQSN